MDTEDRVPEEMRVEAEPDLASEGGEGGETPPARPSRLRRFVMFPLVRAFIGILMVGLAANLAGLAVRRVLVMLLGHEPGRWSLAVVLPTVLAGVGAYVWFVIRVERRAVRELAPAEALRGLGAGIGLGAGVMGVIVATIWAFGAYSVAGSNGFGALLVPLTIAISSGFLEELIFRGLIYRITEEALGTAVALGFTSALFGLAHLANRNATPWSALAIALEAGLLLGAAYTASRSLWLPIGLHMGWNFAQGGLLGAAVSGFEIRGLVTARLTGPELLTGGGFGPEASIPAVVVGVAVAVVLLVIAADRHQIVPLPWRRGMSQSEATPGGLDSVIGRDRDPTHE